MKPKSPKYNILLILACLFCANISLSQSIYWQREYKGPTYYNFYGEGICKADSGNYFLL